MLPILDYSDIVYDCLTKRDSEALQRMQNGACRIILMKGKRTSTDDMHKALNLFRLADRRHLRTMEYMYRVTHDLIPNKTRSLFKLVSETHERQTRSASGLELVVPNRRLETSKKDIRIRGPQYWKLVDRNLQISCSLASFKYQIRKSDMFKIA